MDTISQSSGKTNSKRKQEHLSISLNQDVSFKGISTGLENYAFIHQALPELDMEEIDISLEMLGKNLAAPLIISPMVGGIESAININKNLARAAQELGLAMGVGSQRCAIDEPQLASTYEVRDVASDILLFANLGAVQFNYGYGLDECLQAIRMIDADGLILHLNPLQEALQPKGNTNFAGLLAKIEMVCTGLNVPVIVKEVGWGISQEVAAKLASAGVFGIDTAGVGGTSWSEVERHRGQTIEKLASDFTNWGIPTAESIQMVRRSAPDLLVIGSGGIRTGLDVAKVIALGADAAGIAMPLLKAANISADSVVSVLKEVIQGLKLTMFCSGIANLKELKNTGLLKRMRG